MGHSFTGRRVLSLLLACVMLLTCTPAAFAESATAALMRLMKTEGTVSITNSKGRSVTVRDDIRLNSGYSLKTEEASYAWINLDDVKLAKMDAVSDINIRKSGKKLDILVNSGSLFFNVKKPLEEEEILNIRTSTMGIGLRGTCGWVRVAGQWSSEVCVLEGTVEVTVTDPVTGETKTETISGGEKAVCRVYPQDTAGSRCGIIREDYTTDDIDGYVLVELVPDRSLCDQIYEDSGLDLRGWTGNADSRLKEEQAEIHRKLEEIGTQFQRQESNVVPVWSDPVIDETVVPNPSCPDTYARTAAAPGRQGAGSASGYTDVPADAPYAEAVEYCREYGLMNGTSAATFSPDGAVTRAMLVTALHRLAGRPYTAEPAAFSDVPAGKWYTEAISWASGKGIVHGYNASTFGINDPVTHEQLALILQRYSGNPSAAAGGGSPKAPATRAEVAVALMDCAKSKSGLSALSAINVMCSPSGIALDKDGSLLVTDVYNKRVWQVQNRNGTAYAGSTTVPDIYGQPMGGYHDAGLDSSSFQSPWAIVPFLDGWAVSDRTNNAIRLIRGGSVETLNAVSKEKLAVTELGVAFNGPTGLASDSDGNLYVSDTLNGAVRRITPQGGVVTLVKSLYEPMGLCWKDGALYIAEAGRNRIIKLEDGRLDNLAGTGTDGLTDGKTHRAAFSSPQGVTVGDDGTVYVADTGNGAVRMIQGDTVTTLAVHDPEQTGGGLMSPTDLLVQENTLYICDTFARKIFVLTLA